MVVAALKFQKRRGEEGQRRLREEGVGRFREEWKRRGDSRQLPIIWEGIRKFIYLGGN